MNQIDPYQNHCNFTHQSSHPVDRREKEDMVVWKEESKTKDSQAIRIPSGDFPYDDSHDSADNRTQNTGVETITKKVVPSMSFSRVILCPCLPEEKHAWCGK